MAIDIPKLVVRSLHAKTVSNKNVKAAIAQRDRSASNTRPMILLSHLWHQLFTFCEEYTLRRTLSKEGKGKVALGGIEKEGRQDLEILRRTEDRTGGEVDR